jgi:uncharacterized membrane protein YoaK (UPF0700 family)
MFRNNPEALFRHKNIYIWFLLGFQGGFLNSAGFLGVGRFVSHITGFATLFAVEGARGNWPVAGGLLSTPVFFVFGAMFSAWFVERSFIKNKKPAFTFVFSYLVLWLFIVLIVGELGGFGEFGNHLNSLKNFYYLFTLAFICGLQNATVSSATGNIIRTTHLSGPTTDVGVSIIRVWTYRKDKSKKREEILTLVRIGIIFSFIVGSLIGAISLTHYQYRAFIIPIITSAISAYHLLEVHKHMDDI